MVETMSDKYSGIHEHPAIPCWVEIVAYHRKDGKWDVFIYEPKGSVPELEDKRVDEDHIFFKTIESISELDGLVIDIHSTLGSGYELESFFREAKSRKWIGRIYDHLRNIGKTGMMIQEIEDNTWEILIRRKDFPIAAQVIGSNL